MGSNGCNGRGPADDATVVSEADLPTRFGLMRVVITRAGTSGEECLAVLCGRPADDDAPLVRLHSECLTGDVLGSLRCDCGEQLRSALALIGERQCGALVYLKQEGRGVGLANKIRAYALQDRGADTVDANLALGLPVDAREYSSAVATLRLLGIQRVSLLTNNPAKCQALEEHGVTVVRRVPLPLAANPFNAEYLRTKVARMGHLISGTGEELLRAGDRPTSNGGASP